MNASLNSPGMANPVSGYALAQSILGIDFITPEEVTKARPSIVYTDEQITELVEGLPSEDVLKWCKEHGYTMMPLPPPDTSAVFLQSRKQLPFRSVVIGTFSDPRFYHDGKKSCGWLLIKKAAVPDSIEKAMGEQIKALSLVERVPNADEMSWFIKIYFEVRNICLFENICVRTSTLDSGGYGIVVGSNADGLFIGTYPNEKPDKNLGLSAALK